jgi:hypothetical protein
VPGKPWFKGGPVTAIIDAPIETAGLTQANTDALRDQVYEIIAKRVSDLA